MSQSVGSSYTVSLQITRDDGKCDLDFTHHCEGPELAFYAKQFAAIVAAGGGQPGHPSIIGGAGPQAAAALPAKEKKVGKKLAAGAFDCPSVVFSRATRSAPKMETEIRGQAPRTGDGSVHAAIFGEDEEDYAAAAADMQLGNFTPSAYDYAELRGKR